MKRIGVILAAGGGTRMGNVSKAFLPCGAFSVLERALMPFLQDEATERIIIATSPSDYPSVVTVAERYDKPVTVIIGGATRSESSFLALKAAAEQIGEKELSNYIVAIHDCARPFLTAGLLDRVCRGAEVTGGAIPIVEVTDTIRTAEASLDRKSLYAVQTPQAFNLKTLLDAAKADGGSYTDDATLFERQGGKLRMIVGDTSNKKLTYSSDLPYYGAVRVGIGEDIHRLVEGRELILGGVRIPYYKGLDGHSDADALLHAVMDAILSALSLGDIGEHFPDTDPSYEGVSGVFLLHEVKAMMEAQGYSVQNVSAVVTAQEPKLSPYRKELEESLAALLDIQPEDVGITFKTAERLGVVGEGKAVAVSAIVALIEE